MRLEFSPPRELRAALQARLARLRQPAAALEVLSAAVAPPFRPTAVSCTVQSVHPDRFVVRVHLRARSRECAYVLKAYADDFGERVWAHARTLAAHPLEHGRVCLPAAYVAPERVLVFPWVDGQPLSAVEDGRRADLLRQAAGLAADLHKLPLAPEPPTTAAMLVDAARDRCDRLRRRWPDAAGVVTPLEAALDEAAALLDPAEPAGVHGDLWAGQIVWTGSGLVLLDLDAFGYADPAYDAGHFLAQLERQYASGPAPVDARPWTGCFRAAYLAAMPSVSPRNVSFYQALTLVRKVYTVRRTEPAAWPRLGPRLAALARQALHDVAAPAEVR